MASGQSELLRELSRRASEIHKKIVSANAKPHDTKTMRLIPTSEAADLIGISNSTLRGLHISEPEISGLGEIVGGNNRRAYTLSECNMIREHFYSKKNDERYLRRRKTGDKLQVVAISNFKGGAAKTTTSIHLAEFLAMNGYRVLAIDMDSQASMTSLFGHAPYDDFYDSVEDNQAQTVYGLLAGITDDPRDAIIQTHIEGLDLIPANLDLHKVEFELPARQMKEPTFEFWSILKRQIERVEYDYDFVVIDCPPRLDYATMNAIFCATGLIIPVCPGFTDFTSTGQYCDLLADILQTIDDKSDDPKEFDFVSVLTTRLNVQDDSQKQINGWMSALFGDMLLKNNAVQSVAVEYAAMNVETLYELDVSTYNRKTYQRARESMDDVNRDIWEIMLSVWQKGQGEDLLDAIA